MTKDEQLKSAMKIIKDLIKSIEEADDYADKRDGFTIYTNSISDAVDAGEKFINSLKN